MKVTKMYVAPALEELEIAVEQGFATTGSNYDEPGFDYSDSNDIEWK